jgi:hypothetical protein
MSATGLEPDLEDHPRRVSPERLAEFDRLVAQGGVKAVIEAAEEQVAGVNRDHLR